MFLSLQEKPHFLFFSPLTQRTLHVVISAVTRRLFFSKLLGLNWPGQGSHTPASSRSPLELAPPLRGSSYLPGRGTSTGDDLRVTCICPPPCHSVHFSHHLFVQVLVKTCWQMGRWVKGLQYRLGMQESGFDSKHHMVLPARVTLNTTWNDPPPSKTTTTNQI